jgi:3-polyprenyl-4-hydroxybenzoate decarboxylase
MNLRTTVIDVETKKKLKHDISHYHARLAVKQNVMLFGRIEGAKATTVINLFIDFHACGAEK